MAEIVSFNYTKTGVDGLVRRTLIVLNEDENRIGGLEITGVDEKTKEDLAKRFAPVKKKGFTRRPKGTPKPEYEEKLPYEYRAFSKSKINEYNKALD